MIAQVLNSYEIHLDFLQRLVSDLNEEQMVAQPNGAPNHPAWTIGHLVQSCQAISGELGLAAWLPDDWQERFGTGSTPVCDTTQYPDKEALLSRIDEAKTKLSEGLHDLGDSGLTSPLPDIRYRDRFPTIGHAVIHILSGHTALHLGQLTVWRRAMGLSAKTEPLDSNHE